MKWLQEELVQTRIQVTTRKGATKVVDPLRELNELRQLKSSNWGIHNLERDVGQMSSSTLTGSQEKKRVKNNN